MMCTLLLLLLFGSLTLSVAAEGGLSPQASPMAGTVLDMMKEFALSDENGDGSTPASPSVDTSAAAAVRCAGRVASGPLVVRRYCELIGTPPLAFKAAGLFIEIYICVHMYLYVYICMCVCVVY